MAQRKSTKQTEARARARELAAASLEREKRLVEVAERYFVAAAEVEDVDAWEAEQIAKVRDQGKKKRATAESAMREAVADVLAEGVSKADAAKRLDTTAREVRRLSEDEQSRPAESEGSEDSGRPDDADDLDDDANASTGGPETDEQAENEAPSADS